MTSRESWLPVFLVKLHEIVDTISNPEFPSNTQLDDYGGIPLRLGVVQIALYLETRHQTTGRVQVLRLR